MVMTISCFLLWVDNEVPMFPIKFEDNLNYYNLSIFFTLAYLFCWALFEVGKYKQNLLKIAFTLSVIVSLGFVNTISYLEVLRGSGLSAIVLAYIATSVIFSTNFFILSSLFIVNSLFFYYIMSQVSDFNVSNYKMSIFFITIFSCMIFYILENLRRKIFDSQRLLENKVIELDKALDVKAIFFNHMIHELRTPLNAIIGFSEMILQDIYQPKTIEKIKEYVGLINSGGNHLLSIVTDILDSTKIEAGEINVSLESINIYTSLQRYIDEIGSITDNKEQSVKLISSNEDLYIHSDERLLKQIFFNLLSNAQKFTPRGGEIELAITSELQNNVMVTIKDNGKGMDEKLLDSANSDNTTDIMQFITNAEGTGFGLIIVRQLIRLIGGTIIFESESGVGTSVVMCFPLSNN